MTLFDVPVTLPQTGVGAGTILALATVQLPANAKLDLRWLQLFVIAATANSTTTTPTQFTINPAYLAGGIASIFLVQDWNPISSPWIQTVTAAATVTLPLSQATTTTALPQVAALDSATPVDIATAGNYTFVLVNNTTSHSLDISVTGAVTLDIDPLAT